MLMDSITYVTGADHNYDVAGSTLSTPANDDVVMRFRAVRAFKIPASATGSTFFAEVTATGAAATFNVQKNDSTIGTLTFNIGQNTPVVSFTNEVSFAVGDRLEVVCTAANSIDQVYFTFKTLAA